MCGGVTTWGESVAIARIEAALVFKVGQRLLGQVQSRERKGGQKILDTLGSQGQQHIADVGKAADLENSTVKRTFSPRSWPPTARARIPLSCLA